MEAQPVGLVVAVATLLTTRSLAAQPVGVGSIILLSLGLLWWAMFAESVLRRTKRARLVGWLNVLGWLLAFVALGSPYALQLADPAELAALFLDALLVTWCWRRGMQRAQAGFEYAQFISSFKIGFGIILGTLLLVIVLPQQTDLRDALANALPVYFLSGLLAISLARLGAIRGDRRAQDGTQSDPTRPWLIALSLLGVALLLIIVVIEVLFPFHSFVSVLTALDPLVNAIKTLVGWLLYALIYLLWPVYLLFSFLLSLLKPRYPQQQTQPSQQQPPHKLPPNSPQPIPPALYNIATGVLIALAVLIVALLIRAFLKRRMVGDRDESVEEVREGLNARSLLGQRWRDWWNRRHKTAIAVPLEALDPDSARARYREMLVTAAASGDDLRRKPAETPAEYQARLLAYMNQGMNSGALSPSPAAVPETPADWSYGVILDELTGAYNRERYGGKPTDDDRRGRLRLRVPHLLRRLSGSGNTPS